ncbi:HIT domain-containing protein [Aestuariibacter sp. GS-14]|uniref:HIT domain-containing protein n=1 Tax=Aestuariibacter sp. GS-14 TaxID=2590670 RepID=UPI00112BDBAA|nr:HIT domain-containing protein [Aestuariibacter sp. GS-14]TPV55436.1 HIT domain-containing protein [Aestuariibacter sp. GS-14]
MFNLDSRLAADTLVVGDLPLCRVLLMNDSQYPWLILVPRVAGAVELTDLTDADYQTYSNESRLVAKAILQAYPDAKLNIAALGNVVSQLHIHHVARFNTDVAWPGPIWGKYPVKPYTAEQANVLVSQFQTLLSIKD